MVSRIARSALAVFTTCVLCAPTVVPAAYAADAATPTEPVGTSDESLGTIAESTYPLFASYPPEYGNWLYLIRDEVKRGMAFNPPVFAKFTPEYQLVDPPEGITYDKVIGPDWLVVDEATGRISITDDLGDYLTLKLNGNSAPEQLYPVTVRLTYPDDSTFSQNISVALFDNMTSYALYNNPATVEEPRFPRRPLRLTPGETLTLTRENISWKDPHVVCGDKPGADQVKCAEREQPGFWPDGLWNADLTVKPQPREENPTHPLLDPKYVNITVENDEHGEFQALHIHAEKALEELANQGNMGGDVPIRFEWKARDGFPFTNLGDDSGAILGTVWDTVPLYVEFGNLADKDNYVPRKIAPISTVTGQEASTPLPAFDSAGIQGAPDQPVEPVFDVLDRDGNAFSDWISVEGGNIVARPTKPEHVGTHTVPMQVTFNDGSVSPEFDVTVTVAPLASTAEPQWADQELERGTTSLAVPHTGKVLDGATVAVESDTEGFTAAAHTDGTIDVKAPATAAVGTKATFTVTTKYTDTTDADDATFDTDTFVVTVTAPPGDTVDAVSYPEQRVARGAAHAVPAPEVDNITFAPVTDADKGEDGFTGPTPTWATVESDGGITLSPETDLALGEYTVPVRVEDGRGDARIVDVAVHVGANRADVSYPEANEVYAGEQATIAPADGPRDGLSFALESGYASVDKQGTLALRPTLAEAGEQVLRVQVTDASGDSRTVDVPVTVRTLNDDFAPEWGDAQAPLGEQIAVHNVGDALAADAVIEASLVDAPSWETTIDGETVLVTPGEDAQPGDTVTLNITATYDDESTDTQTVSVRVTEARAYRDSSYEAPVGETTTVPAPAGFAAEDEGTRFDLPQGSAFADWVEIDRDTGAATLTPAMTKRAPGFVAAGSYEVPVEATLPGGRRVELRLPVEVTSLADNLSLQWEDVTTRRGTQTVSKNVGDALPEGTMIAASGPRGWGIKLHDAAGSVVVTPPAGVDVDDASPVRVTLMFTDGSSAEVTFTATAGPGAPMTGDDDLVPTPTSAPASPTTPAPAETERPEHPERPETSEPSTAVTTEATTTAPTAPKDTSAAATTTTLTTAQPTTTPAPEATPTPTDEAAEPTATTDATEPSSTSAPVGDDSGSADGGSADGSGDASADSDNGSAGGSGDASADEPAGLSAGSVDGSSGASISMALALAASPLLLLLPISLAQQVHVPGLTPALDQLDAQLHALPPEVVRPLDAALKDSGFHLGGAAAAGGVVLTSIAALSIVLATAHAQGEIGSSTPQ